MAATAQQVTDAAVAVRNLETQLKEEKRMMDANMVGAGHKLELERLLGPLQVARDVILDQYISENP